MSIKKVSAGKNIPDDINVVIEIPAFSSTVKYEIEKRTGEIFVDRFIPTAMYYPCNYGYINKTLSLDKDPLDVLIPTLYPIQTKSVIRSRPIGILKMEDESGQDNKIIAVPHHSISDEYCSIKDIKDLPKNLKNQITHFFKNYKKLESKKWVRIIGFSNVEEAKKEILYSNKRYNKRKSISIKFKKQ